MKTIFTKINFLINITVSTLFLVVIIVVNSNAQSQDRRHPLSEISSTAKYYSYTYIINSTTKKEIEYFIVQDGSSNIKSAFNACEVCYKSDKGYSQVGDIMKCNNCGNQYPIDNLGSQGQGGCWPGFLPHSIIDGEIVIQISEIEKGAYLFPEEQISGVNEPDVLPPSFNVTVNNNGLHLRMPNSAERKVRIFDINALLYFSESISNNELSVSSGKLVSGVYILTIEEAGKVYFRMLNIGR